jgi:hypothetical protein
MAWTFITNTAAGGTASSVTTSSIDTTGATLLVVGINRDASTNAFNLSDNKGNSFIFLNQVDQGVARCALFYSIPTSVGSGHTFTNTGTNNFSSLFVLAFSGDRDQKIIDAVVKSNASSTTVSPGSITPTLNDSLLVTGLSISGAGTPISIDSSFTETNELDFSSGNYYGGAMAYKIQTTGSAETPTWTRTNSNPMASVMVSFRLSPDNKLAWIKG